jgi:TRAP-type C4-dicarboxylate transport system substrate-binding protein
MKKQIAVLTLMLTFAVLFTGCTNSTPSASTPPVAGADSKVYELKLAHYSSPNGVFGTAFTEWAERVEQETNGRVVITIFPGGAMGGLPGQLDLVSSGGADITWGFAGSFPGQQPLTQLIGLPGLGIPSAEQGSQILWEWYATSEALQKEYANFKVLTMHTHGPAPVCTVKKEISTLADLKGLNIRAPGGGVTNMFMTLGAIPVGVAPNDLFANLDKGVIDGYTIGWEGINSYNLHEVTKYVLDGKFYVGPFWVLMNTKTWNSLPPDLQENLNRLTAEAEAEILGKMVDFDMEQAKQKFTAQGAAINELSAEEAEAFIESMEKVQNDYIAELEGQGLPAQAEFDNLKLIIEKYVK